MEEQFPQRASKPGRERLRLQNFSVFPSGFLTKPAVQNISLSVRAGEILGIAGLQGSGASELLMGLFGGYGRATRGSVFLDSRRICPASPRQTIQSGMALLTNDRKGTGLVLSLSVIANATLASLRELSPGGWRQLRREREAAETMIRPLKLHAASLDLEAGMLSGGNQQKVVIAKWLQTRPKLLLLDDPTRGVDIVAKHEIYQLMKQWTAQGMAILLLSSELPELLSLSDRIIVLHRGRFTREFSNGQATPGNILMAAMGQPPVEPENEALLEPVSKYESLSDGSAKRVESA